MADVLGQHVTLEVECIDRMSLNVSQPRWQSDRGVVSVFRFHRGHTFASSALREPISNAFLADVERFLQQQRIPLMTFRKGERKEDLVLPYRQAANGRERVLVVGKAQEKTPALWLSKNQHGGPRSGAIPKPARPIPGS